MNVSKVCRVCLNETIDGLMTSVYLQTSEAYGKCSFSNIEDSQFDSKLWKNSRISELIIACNPNTVIDHHAFPKQLCEKCLRQLFSAYSFHMHCLETNSVLQNMISDSWNKDICRPSDANKTNGDDFNVIREYGNDDVGRNRIKIEESEVEAISVVNNCHDFDVCDGINRDAIDSVKNIEIVHINVNDQCRFEPEEVKAESDLRSADSNTHQAPSVPMGGDLSIHRQNRRQKPPSKRNQRTIKNTKTRTEKKKHEPKPKPQHACSVCHEVFRGPNILRKHLISHQNRPPISFECDYCARKFKQKSCLKSHLLNLHTKSIFICKVCGEEFYDFNEFDEHKRKHKRKTEFLCSDCGEHFKTNNALKIHTRKHTGERPYKCDQCDRDFTTRYPLHIHRKRHSGERPHVCSTCGKAFVERGKLRLHMRQHTGERPYRCTFCDRSFAVSNDLKVHTRRHTGERFECNVCEERFIQMFLLKRHQRDKHGIDVQINNYRISKPKGK